VAVFLLLPLLCLGGIVPFSVLGDMLELIVGGLSSGAFLMGVVSLAVSLLTLFSMTKIWANVFWGPPEIERPAQPAVAVRYQALMLGSTAALVVLSLVIALYAGPLYDLSERAAEDLLDPRAYVETVLGP
jgi:multicomponent Na+:H+ antiporter subunit D